MTVSTQAAQAMVKFFEDFGTAPNVVKSVARRMKLSESVVTEAAATYETTKRKAVETQGDAARDRQIRESAELLAGRANRAEADLRHASTGDLHALTALKFGRS